MLTEKRPIIPIHVEDFCKTSLIELFTKTPEYILGHDVEYGFSIHRKLAKNLLDFFDISKNQRNNILHC